jgi:hypothetical protein
MDLAAADLAADAAKIDRLHVPKGVDRLTQSAWQSDGRLPGVATVVLGAGATANRDGRGQRDHGRCGRPSHGADRLGVDGDCA